MDDKKKVIIKDILKFLCGAFFVTAGASWWFACKGMTLPFVQGMSMSPDFLWVRGFFHFAMFLVCLYLGFIKKWK